MDAIKNIYVIESTVTVIEKPLQTPAKRKVAAYACVSTDKDEQQGSYEAQIDYFTKMIENNKDWEFVKVYSDEGISGTSTRLRKGFQSMIGDALFGKRIANQAQKCCNNSVIKKYGGCYVS